MIDRPTTAATSPTSATSTPPRRGQTRVDVSLRGMRGLRWTALEERGNLAPASRPSSVDEWAPLFTLFAGTGRPKFTDEQIVDPHFALTQSSAGTWCKLCDAHIGDEGPKAHMRRHAMELREWRRRRERVAAKRARATLRKINRERSAA